MATNPEWRSTAMVLPSPRDDLACAEVRDDDGLVWAVWLRLVDREWYVSHVDTDLTPLSAYPDWRLAEEDRE